MEFNADAAYQAFVAKDARFDGQVFVGVTSTGVYCRPICRVRTPKRDNCRFFSTPELAEAARFRPCLKCRPEIAPQAEQARWSVMDASRTLARQAAALLDAQLSAPQDAADSGAKLAALARRLGISDRHLRRIFLAEMGVTPLQYLQTRRLLLAKSLLTDSTLPVTQVALASGFGSVRRFNAAFSEAYRLTPSRLRETGGAAPKASVKKAAAAPPGDAISVRLAYRAPYDAAQLGRFLAQRAIPGIEQVLLPGTAAEAGLLCIRRSLRGAVLGAADGSPQVAAGWLQAWFDPRASQVRLDFSAHWMPHTGALLRLARRWLDLDAAPETIDAALRADLPGHPGQRLPGSLDAFELVVRAVLGQQVTVAAARTLATRLVDRFGAPLATPWPAVSRSFVEPETLAALGTDQVAALGLPGARARTLIHLAAEWPRLDALLQDVAAGNTDVEALIATLCELPGIGPWTAHYIAMRALSWPDAALPGDVALRKAMQRLFGTATPRAAEERALAWRPWRSYAALRLWDSLAAP